MKRFPGPWCLFVCLLLASCGSGGRDDPWEAVPLGTKAEFRDVFFLDAMNGWIVGSAGIDVPGGTIGRTRDGGRTWAFHSGLVRKRPRTLSVGLNAVCFTDSLHGTIAAAAGMILHTVDGGETWRPVPPTGPVYARNRDLCFVDAMNGWIIGRQGVLKTEDGGGSWLRVDREKNMDGTSIHFTDRSHGWVVGKFGSVRRTSDGGVTWEEVEALGSLEGVADQDIPTLTSVFFADRDHGWIAGYRQESDSLEQHDHAVILHTGDGGRTWRPQLQDVESRLQAVRFADAQVGWAVGYNANDNTSSVFRTRDGGRTWALQTTVAGEKLLALEVGHGHAWTVGARVLEGPQELLRLSLAVGIGKGEGGD